MNPAGALWALALLAQGPSEQEAETGKELLGRPAPSLEGVRWVDPNTAPDLRGNVILLRWWTEGCTFCTSTAPAIRELADRFRDKGLLVVAIYHPKPRPRPVEDGEVKRAAKRTGYPYVLGVDDRWDALRRWWLARHRRRFTSVTFVLDREGTIAAVHPGGEFHRSEDPDHATCAQDFERIERTIERLLETKAG